MCIEVKPLCMCMYDFVIKVKSSKNNLNKKKLSLFLSDHVEEMNWALAVQKYLPV